MNRETAEIKKEHFDALLGCEVIMLVKADYGWNVEHWLPDGVAPTSGYDTPTEAGARALQLMKIKEPVEPQSWAEVIGLGISKGPPPRHLYPEQEK